MGEDNFSQNGTVTVYCRLFASNYSSRQRRGNNISKSLAEPQPASDWGNGKTTLTNLV